MKYVMYCDQRGKLLCYGGCNLSFSFDAKGELVFVHASDAVFSLYHYRPSTSIHLRILPETVEALVSSLWVFADHAQGGTPYGYQ